MPSMTALPSLPIHPPVRRAAAGPWTIELLPGAAYEARYVATEAAIGFAFDGQRGVHAIASDRVRPFHAIPNGLAFVPPGCDVFSASAQGGEYLRVIRTDGALLVGERAYNDVIDPPAIALAQRMRAALLRGSVADDWEAWALALAERAGGVRGPVAPRGSMTTQRLRLLDEFIDAGLQGALTVHAMAGMLGLSEGFFIRAFKAAVGTSPHSYVIDRRVARARALLQEPKHGLADVALACGFASQAHMATVFKQRLGVSPSGLR